MARIVDVARRAGVAPSVVSRLLNADPTLRIRPATRDRIEQAARDLQYTANTAARALRRSRAGAIGVAVRDLHNPVYAEILTGARAAARRGGTGLVVIDVDDLAGSPGALLALARGGSIDGLLLQRDGGAADAALLKEAAGSSLPVVVLNEKVPAPLRGAAVDDAAAARLATKHLLALGHRSIGFLQAGSGTSRARERRSGWAAALRDAGLDPAEQISVPGGARVEDGRAAMTELLSRGRLPTALLGGTLLSAIGALGVARDAGLDVPGELSVAAIHDSWFAEHVAVPLTVVRLPLRELGEAAVLMLVDPASPGPRQVLVDQPPPELVVRSSTAPPREARRRR